MQISKLLVSGKNTDGEEKNSEDRSEKAVDSKVGRADGDDGG